MNPRTFILAAALAIPTVAPTAAWAQDAAQPTNNCAATDTIDGTTAEQTRQRLEADGYTDVTGLVKGCDNVWHGQARSGGAPVNVMVAPDGTIRQESD